MDEDLYMVICWTSLAPELNFFNLTYNKAKEIEADMVNRYPDFKFGLYPMKSEC